MFKRFLCLAFFLHGILWFSGCSPSSPSPSRATDIPLNSTSVEVYFSPHGGCTGGIVKEIEQAKSEILVQAYSFISAPIAKALVEAHKRGVHVEAILDKR